MSFISSFHSNQTRAVAGPVDASPAYFWDYDGWQSIHGNIGLLEPQYTLPSALRETVPMAQIIVMLRNPTER